MSAMREALAFQRSVILSGETYTETVMAYESDALAELVAMERVVEAARELRRHEELPEFEALCEALDELDGQTPGHHSPGEAKGEVTVGGVSPRTPSPGVCPCRVHGDPDGDCGENCG